MNRVKKVLKQKSYFKMIKHIVKKVTKFSKGNLYLA